MSGRLYASPAFAVILAVFYAVSLLLIFVGTSSVLEVRGVALNYLELESWILAGAAGAAVVFWTRQCNVWALWTVGFVQPLVSYIPAIIETPALAADGFTLWPPLRVGLVCAGSGWLLSLGVSGLRARDFSLRDWVRWINPAASALTKVEKIYKPITALLGLLSFLANVLYYFR